MISARALLASSDDWLNKAYVELVAGSIQRAEAGFDCLEVEKAIKTLKQPLHVFESRGLDRYRLKVEFQIALACAQAGRLEEADKSMDYVLATAKKIENDRWMCKGLIVKSRIARLRKNPTRADIIASDAITLSEKAHMSPVQTALAFIARAAARLDLEHYEEARQDLRVAFRSSGSHTQTRAVVHLHYATAFSRERNFRQALKYFGEFKKLELGLESAVVRDLGKSVLREIESRREDFFIRRDDPELTYTHHETQLRKFLIRQARQRFDAHDHIAKALGISRQTLYNWLSNE